MTYTVNLGAVRAAWNAYGGQARGALDIAMAIPVKAGDARGLGDLAPFLQTASARMDAMAQISATVIDEFGENIAACLAGYEADDEASEVRFNELT